MTLTRSFEASPSYDCGGQKQDSFKAISVAYDLLGDPEKRRRFDTGEIDASEQERPQREYYRHYAGEEAAHRYDPGPGFGAGMSEDDLGDIFSQFFGGRGEGRGRDGVHRDFHARGQDLRYHLEVDFLDAARGTKRRVTMPDGNSIEIAIPPGLRDCQTLQLRGKGPAGLGQCLRGDALVTVSVRSHPVFTRVGDDIEIELPITFDDAVLGAKIEVPTVEGPVSATIPKAASSDQRLRLRGILLADTLSDVQAYFRAERLPYRGTIGAPGSRVRQLRERRDQVLLRLQFSYAKLKVAKGRVEHRRSGQGPAFSLSFHSE